MCIAGDGWTWNSLCSNTWCPKQPPLLYSRDDIGSSNSVATCCFSESMISAHIRSCLTSRCCRDGYEIFFPCHKTFEISKIFNQGKAALAGLREILWEQIRKQDEKWQQPPKFSGPQTAVGFCIFLCHFDLKFHTRHCSIFNKIRLAFQWIGFC